VEWYKFADQPICLFDLNIQNSLVVQALSLNHLSVMDAHCQKNCVHDLAQNELNDLVLELLREEDYDDEPCDDVDSIGDYKVAQKHISHHENQAQGKLNLQLVETSNGPLAQVFGLVGQEDN
tara:strand:- start:181 stop:546 length:366 start_codon:yes stop_codon:yes gene_type:complete